MKQSFILQNSFYTHEELINPKNWLPVKKFLFEFMHHKYSMRQVYSAISFFKENELLIVSKSGASTGAYIYVPTLIAYVKSNAHTISNVSNSLYKKLLFSDVDKTLERLNTYSSPPLPEKKFFTPVVTPCNSTVKKTEGVHVNDTETDRGEAINSALAKYNIKFNPKHRCGMPKMPEEKMLVDIPIPTDPITPPFHDPKPNVPTTEYQLSKNANKSKEYIRVKKHDGFKRLCFGFHVKKYKYVYIEK